VSCRYERASLIVTSNKVFGRWGEVFGDDVVAAAMLDRLVHHSTSQQRSNEVRGVSFGRPKGSVFSRR
jgi:DNA replication protein DnaC